MLSRLLGYRRLVLVPLLLGACGSALTTWNPFWRWDWAVYDRLLSAHTSLAPDDIVIVAVDEASLAQHGRWPWARSVHAKLLDRLRADRARVIGLDVVFAEPDASPVQDATLERAMRAAGNVILPVLIEETRTRGQLLETLPLAPIADAAADVGHVGAEIDADGMVRSAYLFEGVGAARWPHFALSVLARLDPARAETFKKPLQERQVGSPYRSIRRNRVLIPYLGPPGQFARVSASQVLASDFAPGTFAGKAVLVGVTATGLGDVLPTPVSGYARPMPGVEINANLLAALRSGQTISEASSAVRSLVAIIVPAVVGVLVVMLPPGSGFIVVTGALALAVAGSLALLVGLRIWLPFLPTAVPILLAYPLVSLVRLQSAMKHLSRSLVRLRTQLGATPDWIGGPVAKPGIDDPVAERLYDVESASVQLDRLQRFVRETLEQMANGVLVTDATGHVVIGNALAAHYLDLDNRDLAAHPPLAQIVDRFVRIDPIDIRSMLARGLPHELLRAEATTADGRQLLVLISPLRLESEKPDGAIVNLADISALRAVERQRRETLAFLSHDLRSPLFSVLAAINNARAQRSEGTVEALASEVERYAQRALELAERFLWLARAESVEDARRVEVNLVDVCEDSISHCLASAQAKSIKVTRAIDIDYAAVLGDPELLERSVINLLDNAIKYSPAGARVHVSLACNDSMIACAVEDCGPGISDSDRERLFRRFSRLEESKHGAGLGLAFVKAVADKHAGRIELESRPQHGCKFTLYLPALHGA